MSAHDKLREFLTALCKREIKTPLEVEKIAYRILQDLDSQIINKAEYDIVTLKAEVVTKKSDDDKVRDIIRLKSFESIGKDLFFKEIYEKKEQEMGDMVSDIYILKALKLKK